MTLLMAYDWSRKMLYEFSFNFHLTDIFKILIFILPIAVYLFSSMMKHKVVRWITKCFSVLLSVFILVVIFVLPIYSYLGIKRSIQEEKLLSCEGVVSDFSSPKHHSWGSRDSESFKINDTEFSYGGDETYGYSKFSCNGGVIKGNGQKMKISYCHDPVTEEKVICYIEKVK